MNGSALLFRDVLHRCGIGCACVCLLALASASSAATFTNEPHGNYATFEAAQDACDAFRDTQGGGSCRKSDTGAPDYVPLIYIQIQTRESNQTVYTSHQFFYTDKCPPGSEMTAEGKCEEDECPDAGEPRTVTVQNISRDALGVLESSGVASDNGCTYTGTLGVSACLVNADATVSCAVKFVSDGGKGPAGAALTVPESRLEKSAPSPKTGSVETDLSHDVSTEAPETVENSDGSDVTVVRETDVTRGPARATVSGSPGNFSGGASNGSTATTTTTTTTNNYSDGGQKVVKQQVNRWINGDSYTFTTNDNGGVTVTRTPGTAGGSTTTTTTTTSPDGSSTTNTTTSNDASDIPNGIYEGTPNCVSGSCTPSDGGNGPDGGGGRGDGGSGAGDGGGGDGGSGEGSGDGDGDGSGEDDGQGDGSGDDRGTGMFGGPCESGQGDESSPGSGYDCAPTISESFARLLPGFRESPIYSEVSSIRSKVPSGAGSCPKTSFEAFGETFEFSPGCELFEQNRSIISGAAKAAWTLLGVAILLGV